MLPLREKPALRALSLNRMARCGGLFIQASTTARGLVWPLANTSPSQTNLRSASMCAA
jgi:hypothetical protein